MTESGQLDLVGVLSDYANAVDGGLNDLQDALSPAIDANPNDKLLMDMLGAVAGAQESLKILRDLLTMMEQRDLSELP